MKFKEFYEKIINESNPIKRSVSGIYAKLYPKQYGLNYRMQYNPDSLKNDKKK